MFKKNSNYAVCFTLSFFVLALIAGTALAFDFSISMASSQGTLKKGDVIKAAINIYWASTDQGYVYIDPGLDPKGVDIYFSPSSCYPPCTSIMTISAQDEAKDGQYLIPIIVSGYGSSRTVDYQLTVGQTTNLGTPTLVSPINSNITYSLTPVLQWTSVPKAEYYEWYLGYRTGRSAVPSLSVPAGWLSSSTKYDWRVRACKGSSNNTVCGDWSDNQSFITPQNNQATIDAIKAQIVAIQAEILKLEQELLDLKAQGL